MKNFIIRTHRPGTIYNDAHYFILNKGMNCGKPLIEPCPNCFVLLFNSEIERENSFWIAYSLWQSNYWHQFLIKSVIPFFRIDGFSNEFAQKSEKLNIKFAQHQRQLKALRLLQQHEEKHNENIRLIKQMRNVVLSWYYK